MEQVKLELSWKPDHTVSPEEDSTEPAKPAEDMEMF